MEFREKPHTDKYKAITNDSNYVTAKSPPDLDLEHFDRLIFVAQVVPSTFTISNASFCICVSNEPPCKQRLFPLNSIDQLIFVMLKCGVLFEVRSEFLNNT
jgi:hypothetical protein